MSELSAVRAKMSCNAVESTQYNPNYTQHRVKLGAVCGDNGEDKSYSDATPSGECGLQISHGRPALDFFKPGKKYYLTFTEAPG